MFRAPNDIRVAMRTRRLASVLAQLLALGLIGSAFFLRAPHVLGLSMEPRIHSGEFVLINTLAYRFARVQRGDIVAFTHDAPIPQTYLKRVVGLPGERVLIRHGLVSVDGRVLEEGYVRYRDTRSSSGVTVPADGLYVLGDNRTNSDDSRNWGVLPQHDVIGRAIVTVWPPHERDAP